MRPTRYVDIGGTPDFSRSEIQDLIAEIFVESVGKIGVVRGVNGI
jgi:hypothetical protein